MVEWKIDVVLMSSTDRRWTEMKLDQMKKQMKSVNKNVEIIASDSREKTKNEDGYLPGGTMAIFTGKIAGMIAKEHNKKDKFGRWTSTRIENGRNKMQIINVYRIPDSTQSGILKSRAQYDRVGGEVKSSQQYRTELLQELSNEINKLKTNGIKGIVIIGDMNQDISND